MNVQTAPAVKPKYFNLDIHGVGYLQRARWVTPETSAAFLAVTVSALRGPAERVQYAHFDCIVVGEEAKDLVRQLMPAIAADMKVLTGFHLSDLQADAFVFKQGERAGSSGVGLKSRLLRFDWIKVDGKPYFQARPRTSAVA